MQTAEHAFRRWMQSLIVIFIIFIGYIVIADRYAPLTTESRVQGYVIQIAPEVSGHVTAVQVSNNQTLKKGDKLFSIDKRKYVLALGKAQLVLEQAHEQEDAMYAKVAAAEANVATNQAAFDNASSEYKRICMLAKQKLVSLSMLDNALANNSASSANLRAAQQELRALRVQLGAAPGQSSAVRTALNNLQQAQLDLSHTQVVAPSDGVVTNLQLEVGSNANSNQPLLTFIPTDSLWVAADFREKAVARIDKHSKALVAFDAFPGKLFPLEVTSRDYGVAAAQQSPNGQLTQVEVSNRWVRDAQRVRINLASQVTLPQPLFIGSRATVVIYSNNDSVWAWLAKCQIKLVSLLHYIY